MLTILTTLALLAAPVPEDQVLNPLTPVLIVKGPGYYLHAIPGVGPTLPKAAALGLGERFGAGLGIYLTDAASGQMRLVHASGTTAFIIPMGIDRIQYTRTRIVGVTADAERLYVLLAVWRTGQQRAPGPIPDPGEFGGPARYSLQVFSLPDGKVARAFDVAQGDFPKEAPKTDNARPGPLELKPDGVACYGTTFKFKGVELLEQRYERK